MNKRMAIKSISVETREWGNGSVAPFINIARWDGERDAEGNRKNYKLAMYFAPTRASVFRSIQAMDAMCKRAAHVQRETSEATI